ncbi:hypothetical protein FH972_024467 [Carpinus fangiana]|uniref:Cullin family profile domain-containing protein n=1 Tax=Carpinus fangiana TaxID=176857 RepID=A0A5N6KYL9_9ROSI|nr:hypothetical protein FH972_024467 [Carpinus fangiana]
MAPSRAAEVAQEHKHQHGQTKLEIAASANKQQQKLSFQSSSPGSFARDCTTLDVSSSSKRRKLDTPPLVDLADAPSRPAAIDSMYNFSTPGSSAANAIDLGASPTNGHRRRVSSVSRVEIPSGKTGAKKLVVKNFRTTPKSDPTQYCDLTIKQLDEALTAIFADRRPTLSNEELYRGCENVCKLGKPDQLAKKLLQRIKQHVSGDLKATPSAAAGGSNVQVLNAVITAWKKWRRQLILGGAADLLMAGRVGLPQWSATLFDATVKMCYDLSIYTHGFEERMLADSQSFIAEWADDNCAKLSLADYVDAANTLIATEETRCEEFNLSTSTRSSLLTVLEHQLVERREAELTNQDSMKHTGRKLQWKHALAHCQLRASFPKGKKEIVVSAFQAIIMLMFNTVAAGATLPYTQIKDQSGLPEADVKRTLQSLACAKLRPLTKHPRGKEVGDNDTFSVNEDFSHDRFRVKINQLQAKETREENRATHEQVAADRKYETQAAIVRIMKTRKTIGHAELIAETINATKQRGTLQPGEIKRQIDALIEKEYMERGDGNTYAYLA